MEYTEGYLAFIDILGFSTFVSDDKNANKTHDLFEFIKKFCYLFNKSPQLDVNVSFFSDSIVLTANNLDSLVVPIYIAESYLKQELGLLFRGGICYGKYYHEKGVTFGPAVVKAYRLEEQAVYSGIIIDREIDLPFENSILYFRDTDGWTYLNPMSTILPDEPVYPDQNFNEDINSCFTTFRKEILHNISKYKGTRVLEKYLWRVRPFNYTCNLLADLPCGEVLYESSNFSMNQPLKDMLRQQIITETDIDHC